MEFDRLLWADGPGDPPNGLEVNAPLRYAEGLAAERQLVGRRQAAAGMVGTP